MEHNLTANSRHIRAHFIIFIASAIVLFLEIGLTRIFSVLFDYHYTFLSISLALLGLGLGAVLYYKKISSSNAPYRSIARATLIGTISLILLALMTSWLSWLNGFYLSALFALTPFLCLGTVHAHYFKVVSQRSPGLYAADLIGAVAGVLAFLWAISLGGVSILLISSVFMSFLTLVIGGSKMALMRLIALSFIALGITVTVLVAMSVFPMRIGLLTNFHKEMFHILNHPGHSSQVIGTQWSSFGRTDLLELSDRPGEKIFFVDGSAGSSMYEFEGNWEDTAAFGNLANLRYFPGFFPVALIAPDSKQSSLIIGPGGGRDIHVLKLAGVKEIEAVEINGDLISMARRFPSFNGGIFDFEPGLTIIEDEGRSYLRRSDNFYDIIYLSIPVTKSSRSPEAFALTENYLFTVESFQDYFEHLTDRGQLIIVAHDDIEILKLVFTAVRALRELGIPESEAYSHLYTAGPGAMPFLVIKKSKVTSEEASFIHAATMVSGNFQPEKVFIPYVSQHNISCRTAGTNVLEEPMLSQALLDLAAGKFKAEEFISAVDINFSPPTDDSPFFYNFRKGPPGVIELLIILAGGLLVIVTGPGFVGHVLSNRWLGVTMRMFFITIGVGFMMLEISLIQQFTLFLGNPTYALSVLLVTLLGSGSIGSLVSGRVWLSDKSKVLLSTFLVAVIAALYLNLTPLLTAVYLPEPISTRIAVTMVWLAPLGFVLGVPFPMAIRIIGRTELAQEIPHLWGINGLSSVLGSAVAIAISVSAGLSITLLVGVLLYTVAFLLSWKFD